MTAAMLQAPIEPIAYEATAALDVGVTFFREHIAPELRVVRVSGKVLCPVAELRRWAREPAEAHPRRGGLSLAVDRRRPYSRLSSKMTRQGLGP